ncbi:beta-galactosidase [Planoprotostelium fungivorum]|uniref:Beta-galactosidase n=1 Tax=Planoprotostelium fungivorum TaxID=1890364 RepID=A0A2P6MZC9_9EUKA|nr:beta-galactosidase [Planoprotostelium fungivorum]
MSLTPGEAATSDIWAQISTKFPHFSIGRCGEVAGKHMFPILGYRACGVVNIELTQWFVEIGLFKRENLTEMYVVCVWLKLEDELVPPSWRMKNDDELIVKPEGSHVCALLLCITIVYAGNFTYQGSTFLKDGNPFLIMSGSIHYFRVAPESWTDRLLKLKAAGFNTVMTYIPWNSHNPQPDRYDFDGILDVERFIKEAEQVGLLVIIRASPYICAEYDLGGIPPWILNITDVTIRSSDPKFLEPFEKFMKVLAPKLSPHQYSRGGPIILLQIENEYGSYGSDHLYMRRLRDSFIENDVADTTFFMSNGVSDNGFLGGTLPDVLKTMNFPASNDPTGNVQWLLKKYPDQPAFVSEWWDGWFDFWGSPHSTTDGKKEAKALEYLLRNGVSVNLYMFVGGTNFAYNSGANVDGNIEATLHYKPITTSYDYNCGYAALNESGDPTEKYQMFREVLKKYSVVSDPPAPAQRIAYGDSTGTVKMTSSLVMDLTDDSLLDKLSVFGGENEVTVAPKSMEYFGQYSGFILYRTKVVGPQKTSLSLQEVHDRVQMYQEGQYLTAYYRNEPRKDVSVDIPVDGAHINLLVENMGRIGFGPFMHSEKKGLMGPMYVGDMQNSHWRSWSFDFENLKDIEFEAGLKFVNNTPTFYRATFNAEKAAETFVYFANFHKGLVWINGNNLGRYWRQGPQQCLYVPSSFIQLGNNTITVLDLESSEEPSVRFSSYCDGYITPQ